MKIITLDEVKKLYPWVGKDIDNAPVQFTQEEIKTQVVDNIEALMKKYKGTVYNPNSVMNLDEFEGVPFYMRTFLMGVNGSYEQAQLYLRHIGSKKSGIFDLTAGFFRMQGTFVQEIVALAIKD